MVQKMHKTDKNWPRFSRSTISLTAQWTIYNYHVSVSTPRQNNPSTLVWQEDTTSKVRRTRCRRVLTLVVYWITARPWRGPEKRGRNVALVTSTWHQRVCANVVISIRDSERSVARSLNRIYNWTCYYSCCSTYSYLTQAANYWKLWLVFQWLIAGLCD